MIELKPLKEEEIYDLWEKSGYFNPDNLPKKNRKPYTIIMPPPNANGALHLGHALGITIEDVFIRFYRMMGRKALWVPGADHAGFETQVVFDKKLEKEGRNRFDIPRDELWQEMYDFTQTNRKIMEGQLRKLGASCDWSRKKFTLDKDIVEQTQRSFVELYEQGLVYRGNRLVNWCPKHQTAFSELEVKYAERIDPLYYIKYGPLAVATVRPETIFGDTALAINPKDERYKSYIGQDIEFDGLLGKIKLPVISDESVDPNFGTGVVKITPAHDMTDFETGLKHELPIKPAIDRYGRLNELTGPYKGMKINEAREAVVSDLQKAGRIEKIEENYNHSVATCYKCGTLIEPMIMPQWYVKMKPLAERGLKAVRNGQIRFVTEHFEKIYIHWLENLRDWNISRQIIWGIRIPAWFCDKCGEITVSEKTPEKCLKCDGSVFKQDPDVLDTWFSSGQWPFLALGFPKSRDYKTYYPTELMETGYDILPFWVSRMIMLGLWRTKKIPFRHIYLHGMVRDKDRQKMSKSKGNVIDPLGVAEIYGADAVRMSLIVGNTPGIDPVVSEDKIRAYRNFTTKIRNAARFVLMYAEPEEEIRPKFSKKDLDNLRELKIFKKDIKEDIEKFRLYEASNKLYHYFWHIFADKIIEEAKPRLKENSDRNDKAACEETLLRILMELIKILHPFMPFVTEEVYQSLPNKKQTTLMVELWN
jgi:valyl-tRNA synthetase